MIIHYASQSFYLHIDVVSTSPLDIRREMIDAGNESFWQRIELNPEQNLLILSIFKTPDKKPYK